jgi:AP endonuclease-2
VFDPIEAKESWSKLLGKRVLPRCEHGDECQTLVTKKPGVNCGMSSSSLVVLTLSSSKAGPASSCLTPFALHQSIIAHPPLVSQPCIICSHLLLVSRMSRLTLLVGRSFFMCARPLGPSGDKEQGTEFRCRTFIWSSDWNGRQ